MFTILHEKKRNMLYDKIIKKGTGFDFFEKNFTVFTNFRIDVANKEGQWDTMYRGGQIHDKLRLVFAASEGKSEEFLAVTLYEVRVHYDENPTQVDESWIEFPFVTPDEKYEADYIFLKC